MGVEVVDSPGSGYHWELCRAKRTGRVYPRLVSDVPRVPDAYVDSVVYLYPSAEAAREGRQTGGCGFTVHVKLDVAIGNHYAAQLYVVTNCHVIDNGHLCVRANTSDGGYDIVESDRADWVHHPDGHDIAILPVLMRREDWRLVAIPASRFLTPAKAFDWNIGPGDDVFLVSRFLAQEGRQQNRPLLHVGVVSAAPAEGEGVLNTHTGLREPSFLVETHSRPGYSGSPVYGWFSWAQPNLGVQRHEPTAATFLLGCAWGFLPAKERLEDKTIVTLSSGIAGVVPAWHIQDLLDDEEVIVPKRKEMERLIREQNPQEPPKPGEGAVPMDAPDDDEFARVSCCGCQR